MSGDAGARRDGAVRPGLPAGPAPADTARPAAAAHLDPARVEAARTRLVRELAGLADAAAASALERCPYRDRSDACTFGRGCRNQRRAPGLPVRCAGGPLDRSSA